jgi:hypothetical protein
MLINKKYTYFDKQRTNANDIENALMNIMFHDVKSLFFARVTFVCCKSLRINVLITTFFTKQLCSLIKLRRVVARHFTREMMKM